MFEKLKTYLSLFLETSLLIFLFFLRVFTLEEHKFYDYDAVSNYLVIQEIWTGDFQHFFQHASPGFYLFYVWVMAFTTQDIWLQYLSAGLNLLSVVVLVEFVFLAIELPFKKNWIDKFVLYIFLGLSFFLLNSALYFSIENLSVLLFFFCFIFYHQSLKKGSRYLIISILLWGILYTVNYKAILLVPIFVLLELIQKKRKLSFRVILWGGLLALIPIFICILIGIIGGLEYWKYPAVIYLSLTATSSGGMGSQFGGDLWYYFKYLFWYENLLLIPGMVLFGYFSSKKAFHQIKQGDFLIQVAFFSICYLAGMSLLLKAPRGLAFIYPFMYLLAWVGLRVLWEKSLLGNYLVKIALIGAIIISFYRAWIYIYPYTSSNYQKVANYLEEHQVQKIVVSVGNKIIPYLQNNDIEIILIRHENELDKYIKQGFEYLLLDDYYQVVNLKNFKKSSSQITENQWVELHLLAPMLHLEHSEFTQFTFEESLQRRTELSRQEYHLHLIKLTKP